MNWFFRDTSRCLLWRCPQYPFIPCLARHGSYRYKYRVSKPVPYWVWNPSVTTFHNHYLAFPRFPSRHCWIATELDWCCLVSRHRLPSLAAPSSLLHPYSLVILYLQFLFRFWSLLFPCWCLQINRWWLVGDCWSFLSASLLHCPSFAEAHWSPPCQRQHRR